MLRFINLLFLMAALSLSGCVFAPGMKMQTLPPSVQAEASHNKAMPIFIPLDVNLISQIKQSGMTNQDDSYFYHVDPHDVLNIYVWGHPELASPVGSVASESGGAMQSPSLSSSGYLVGPSGDIYFPLVGTIYVAGKTVQEVRTQLTGLLKKYIRKPQLDVRVVNFRSKKVYVMGEVMKPSLFPLTDSPMSLVDAITLAGGMDPKTADPTHIFVIRGNYARPYVYWLNAESPAALLLGQGFPLKDHDVVFVSTAPVASWNRAIDQILPSIQTVWFTYSIVKAVNT